MAQAVLRLIQQGNLDFEIQEVAALSGVHRTTLFRRWPDRGALIAEAMAEHVSRLSIELTGTLDADIRRLIFGIRDFFADPVETAMNRMLAITDNEIFHRKMMEYWAPVLERFEAPIVAAQKRGEVSPSLDPSMVVTTVVSTLLAGAVFTRSPVEDEFVERLVRQTMVLLRA